MAKTFDDQLIEYLETWASNVLGKITYPNLLSFQDKTLYLLKKLAGG